MAQSALDQFNPEDSPEILDALADNDVDADNAVELIELNNKVRKQLEEAGNVFNELEKNRWEKRLEQAKKKTDKNELKGLAEGIAKEADRIKEYTEDILDNKDYFGGKTAEDYVEGFRNKPEVRDEWFEKRWKEINERKKQYKEGERILSKEKFAEFVKLDRTEKYEMLDKFNESLKKVEVYEATLDRNKSLFSDAELAKMKGDFRDMPADEQAKTAKDLYDNEIKPREKLAKEFETFTPDRRKDYSHFADSDRKKKEEVIKEMTDKLTQDYKAENFGERIRSLRSQSDAFSWFVKASIEDRCKAFEALRKQIKDEKDLNKELEKHCEQLAKFGENIDKGQFDELSFPDKSKQRDILAATLIEWGKFKEMLKKASAEKNLISEKTEKRYQEKFAARDLNGKKEAISSFPKDMADRRKLLKKFEKLLKESDLSPEEKQERGKAFYKTGLIGRGILYYELEGLPTKNPSVRESKEKSPSTEQLKDMKIEALEHHLAGRLKEALKSYEKILDLAYKHNLPRDISLMAKIKEIKAKLGINKTQNNAKKATKAQMKTAVERSKNKDRFKRGRKNLTILEEFKKAVKNSENVTNQIDATKKQSGLNEKKGKLQENLVKRGKVLEDGKVAKDILELDTEFGLDAISDQDRFGFEKEVSRAKQRASSGKSTDNFQSKLGGKVVSSEVMEKHRHKKEKEERTAMRKDAVNDLKKAGLKVENLKDIKDIARKEDISEDLIAA